MLGELSGLASHWVNVGLMVGMSGVGIRVPPFMDFPAAPVPRSAMTAILASVPDEGAGEVDEICSLGSGNFNGQRSCCAGRHIHQDLAYRPGCDPGRRSARHLPSGDAGSSR